MDRNKMRTFLICNSLVLISLIIKISNLNNKIEVLEYNNTNLQLMVENVISYSDSTADTGEFDEFITSPQGERFVNNYNKLYDK